jgi:hypothetical protein
MQLPRERVVVSVDVLVDRTVSYTGLLYQRACILTILPPYLPTNQPTNLPIYQSSLSPPPSPLPCDDRIAVAPCGISSTPPVGGDAADADADDDGVGVALGTGTSSLAVDWRNLRTNNIEARLPFCTIDSELDLLADSDGIDGASSDEVDNDSVPPCIGLPLLLLLLPVLQFIDAWE